MAAANFVWRRPRNFACERLKENKTVSKTLSLEMSGRANFVWPDHATLFARTLKKVKKGMHRSLRLAVHANAEVWRRLVKMNL